MQAASGRDSRTMAKMRSAVVFIRRKNYHAAGPASRNDAVPIARAAGLPYHFRSIGGSPVMPIAALLLLALPCPALQDAAEKRIQELTAQLKAAPQKHELWHARAKARVDFRDPLGALGDAAEAIRLAPFEPEYRALRATLFAGQGRWR